MLLRVRPSALPLSFTVLLTTQAVFALAACAQPAAPEVEVQVLVHRVDASSDGVRIAAEASGVAGVPVKYVAATSPHWHTLLLQCPSAAACETAIGRLAEARAIYTRVQRDERRRTNP